ncbi:winged helix-turn-helix domain-containing protein [Planctomonas psychrotolerans]|uniref:winged helix-turn-helix domain-containing protein n=1 Tax=Planctomonas psychrotolerans TaxID=2528712 RepID=UPI00123B6618|nr:crosslink repair DNA glycosylase YcaQ family protein [Planctomonas psychrotolerans]
MVQNIPPALARRVALAAQGFGRPRPVTVGGRAFSALFDRIHLLQLDSVNVFERSHYLPVLARLGAYDRAALDRLMFRPNSGYIEYWAHEAAVLPVDDWPLFRWRMADRRRRYTDAPGGWVQANGPMLDWLRAELAENGPLPASRIEHDSNRRSGSWWGWSDVKRGLEMLFGWGEVVSAGRTRFERSYGLAEHVLPPHVFDREIPRDDAIRELVRRSVAAHGIGTLSDFADYYRLPSAATKAAIRDLEDAGEVLPVRVAGWDRNGVPERAWLHRDARRPRRMDAAALLSPFDPVVWRRERAERMFDFHYRIEIYTPQPKRVFGYYVLPVLLDDRIVGRIDLKSDRQAGVLRVQSAWTEESVAPGSVADRVAVLVREAAAWQGLDDVAVVDRGTLAAELARALGTRLLDGERADAPPIDASSAGAPPESTP